jgi:Protein of unknown function (DUF3822)
LLLGPDENRILYFNKIKSRNTENKFPGKQGLDAYFRFNEKLHYDFKHATLGIWQPDFTLAPASISDGSVQKKILSFNSGQKKDWDILIDDIGPEKEINFLTVIDPEVKDWFLVNFKNAGIVNAPASLIRYFIAQNHAKQLIAYINEGFLELIYIENGNIRFYNAYPYQSIEDGIYFILLAYHQMDLSTEGDVLTIAGEIMPDSNLYIGLYKYIRNIQFAPFPEYLNIDDEKDLINHRYLNLFLL